jgi:hypothetical protein
VIPLWIPRFPLPAILGCLVTDAIDQSVFQAFTRVDLSAYQGYDKALDIFYLSVAMLSMYRNWVSRPAIEIGRALFYLRLAGVLSFELTGWRPMLFLLPNAFEYYFIVYEVLRTRWSPRHLKRKDYAWAAGVIWLLKLPQEYWIHIARLDFTTVLKGQVLRAPDASGWAAAIQNSPISFSVMIAAFGALAVLVRAAILRFAGPPQHAARFSAPAIPERIDEATERDREVARSWRLLDIHLVEKVVLAAVITIIFAQIVPGVSTGPPRLVLGTSIIVTINAFLGLRRARAGGSPESGLVLYLVIVLTNVVIAGIAEASLRLRGGGMDLSATMFFLLLVTLVVTLYDRWRPVFDVRFNLGGPAPRRSRR